MVQEINKYDKSFTEEAFYKYAEDIFNALLNSLMTFNIFGLYDYLSEPIYTKYVELTNGYKQMNIKRVFENVEFKNKMIQSCKCDENTISIKLLLITRYKDYFINPDGSFINEKETGTIEKGHYITFTRDLISGGKYIITEMDVI